MYRRRRRSVLLALLLLLATVAGVGLLRRGTEPADRRSGAPPAVTHSGVPAVPGAAAPVPVPAAPLDARAPVGAVAPTNLAYPQVATGRFGYAPAFGRVLGSAGALRRFHIAAEIGVGQDAAAFGRFVDRILGDPRSWAASGQVRLQRVPQAVPAQFTIFVASPVTSERMCAAGGLHTDRFTSCRLPGRVIINVARWLTAIPDYNAPLLVYQAYAINHEVGHELGRGHESCPGPGRPAPVMQQQTYGLKGCVANPWPYLAGVPYSGPAVP